MAHAQSRLSASLNRRGSTTGVVFMLVIVGSSLVAALLQKAYVWIQQLMTVQRTTYQEVVAALESQGCGLTGLIQVVTFLYRSARPLVIQMYTKHS